MDKHLERRSVSEAAGEVSPENAEVGSESEKAENSGAAGKKEKKEKKETGIFEWFEQHLDRRKDDPEKQELENMEDGMRRTLSPEELEMETEVLRSDSVVLESSPTEKLAGAQEIEEESGKAKRKSGRKKK